MTKRNTYICSAGYDNTRYVIIHFSVQIYTFIYNIRLAKRTIFIFAPFFGRFASFLGEYCHKRIFGFDNLLNNTYICGGQPKKVSRMKHKLFFISSLLLAFSVCERLEAQGLIPQRDTHNYKLPVLGISADSLRSFYANGVHYPDSLLNSEDETLFRMSTITFMVGKDCHVSDIQVKGKSAEAYPFLANEAARLTAELPFTEPAMSYDSVACRWVAEDFPMAYLVYFNPHSADRVWGKDSIIDRLSHCAYHEAGSDGWSGVPGGWILQQKLSKQTTIDEKIALLQHPSPTIRLTAFDGIVESDDHRAVHLLAQHLADTAKIMIWSFDVGWDEHVADAMISNFYNPYDAVRPYSTADSLMLDSLILFDPNVPNLDYKCRLLNEIEPREQYYDRIRELYVLNNLGSALTTLAKYKKEADKQLISEALLQYHKGLDKQDVLNGEPTGNTFAALNAVQLWPDACFWPALTKVRDYEIQRKHYDYGRIRALLLAIMAYDDDFSYQFLVESFDRMKKAKNNNPYRYFTRELKEILEKHPEGRYTDLMP